MTDEQDESQGSGSQGSFGDLMQLILENTSATEPSHNSGQSTGFIPQQNDVDVQGECSSFATLARERAVTDIEEFLNSDLPVASTSFASEAALPSVKYELAIETSPDSGYVLPRSNETMLDTGNHDDKPKLYEIPPQPMLPVVPPKGPYPGRHGFEVTFIQTESAAKNANHTYSHLATKLYAKMSVPCPVQFSCKENPPPGSYVRAMMVFLYDEHALDVVTRCPGHLMKPDPRPHLARHFIQTVVPQNCFNDVSCYDEHTYNRSSVTVPMSRPNIGEQHCTVLYKFMCRSSCVGGINRRPVGIVFTLEDQNGEVLGRSCVEVKICSAPGRDRIQDENRKRKHEATVKIPVVLPKKPKTQQSQEVQHPAQNDENRIGEYFLLRVKGKENYEILKRINDALQLADLATEDQLRAVRQDNSKALKEMLSMYLAELTNKC